ncbi:MAG: RNA polymerase sigma factor [Acidobacteriota bacterium]
MAPPSDADRILVDRLLRGEQSAFEEFFEGYFPRLYRFALARANQDAGAAEDIVQATLLKAISALRTYRGEAALFTWLCTFCRHEISAYYGPRNRAGQPVPLLEDSPEVRAQLESLAAAMDQGPERDLERGEVARLVQVALDSLPAKYGDILEWKYIHAMPVKEIAARLQVGPKAAESLLTRARQSFRDAFVSLTGGRLNFGSAKE